MCRMTLVQLASSSRLTLIYYRYYSGLLSAKVPSALCILHDFAPYPDRCRRVNEVVGAAIPS